VDGKEIGIGSTQKKSDCRIFELEFWLNIGEWQFDRTFKDREQTNGVRLVCLGLSSLKFF